ncbi:regulatory protein GemA [Paracoccaceae bacterium Fryx2]|nr:regulatory protein GemA [Paracoccaceae bacterium Fryx2]
MIRALQRMIHVGCKQLGLDDDTRRDLQLVATGKASMAEMTEADLRKVVDTLKARGFQAGFKDGSKPGKRAAAPRGDVRFCHVMWRLLAEKGAVKVAGPDGLNAFVRARFENAWGSVPIDIDALREWQQISDVVRALKAMCARAGIELT